MQIQLSGEQQDSLVKLLSGTLSEDDLEVFVYAATGQRLYEAYVARDRPLRRKIRELIEALQEEGSTDLLLEKVYARRPNRPDVREFIALLLPDIRAKIQETESRVDWQASGAHQLATPGDARAPGLQKRIRADLPMVEAGWLEQGQRVLRRVCRITFAGRAAGTGFLVGPSTVLTNWHVVQGAARENRLAALRCGFDYRLLDDGTRQAAREIALGPLGLIDSSPYSAAELTQSPDDPPPGAEELDYALLQLAEPLGDEQLDGTTRGWLALPQQAPALADGATLIIAQHPDGAPLKLAIDTHAVQGRVAGGLRIRYTTNTEPGSSGSPCFNLDWQLVALHHYGDPSWQQPLFNQGIPAELIRAQLEARGHGAQLGD
jgi:Trypsin-like peptidase domain/Effector-associated domain 1